MFFDYKRISIKSREKIYLFLAIFSVFLLFYNIFQIKPVIVDVNDFLGLTSHLTLEYWIGLGFIILCSVLIYLDSELKSEWIFIFVLFILGLFLFGVPVFAEINTRMPWSYYPSAEVNNLLATHYIDTISEYPLMSYRSWPAFHFISASIISITGIKLDNLIKYMPIFWVFCFFLITFVIGIRFDFSLNDSFLLSNLALSSFWLSQYYYSPQAFAYIEYLLLFLFIITFSESIKHKFLKLLTFLSLIITHILTPITILAVLFIQEIVYKKRRILIIFFVIFIGWYIHLAPYMFKVGVKAFIEQAIIMGSFSLFSTTKFNPITQMKWIINNFRIAYMIILGSFTVTAVFLYYFKKIEFSRSNIYYFKNCIYWLIGLSILVPLRYGPEGYERLYVFSLIPILCIIILSFNNKKFVLIFLMISLILLHIPAHYGDESFMNTYTTDIKGSDFLASIITEDDTYFYQFYSYVHFSKPETILTPYWMFGAYEIPDISILNNITYVINSKQTDNRMKYMYGINYVQEWQLQNDNYVNLIYSNGNYTINKPLGRLN